MATVTITAYVTIPKPLSSHLPVVISTSAKAKKYLSQADIQAIADFEANGFVGSGTIKKVQVWR